ncbi:MAG TPA: tetratricopeptide repeat protein [Candidatus Dormibacteraeota bacterium]|nr:tetratricopeptide repeat protein [Candidatus Dormibacteraeota bacterium]
MQRSKISRLVVLLVGLAALCCTPVWPQQGRTNSASVATARADIARGQLDSAEKTLWTVLSSDPNQSEALTLLGIVRGRQKRYPEAEALFRRVLQLDPKSLTAHRNLAEALIAQNKPDAAIEECKEVVRLAPKDYSAQLELAHLYLGRGEFAEALSNLDGIPKDHFPPDAIPAQAASLLGLGRREEAAALIPRVKQSPRLATDLAEVFLEGNAPEYAIQALDAALAGSQHAPARLYYLKGRALQATGNSSAALNNLQLALARDPKSVDTLVEAAALEAAGNRHKESLALLKRAYALQPDSPAVLRPLVVEGIEAGEPKTALRAAQALADKNPDNLDDLYLAAAAMLEGKDFTTAASIFEKYVSKRPDDSKGLLGLGIAQLAQQHFEEATKALERSLEIDPKQADAEYQLGVVADRKGIAADAVQHFERAVLLQPRHAKALAGLGAQYLQAGDLEKARTLLARSVSVNPNDAKSQYDLALVLSKLGKTEEAKQHMELSRALKTAEDLGKSAPDAAKP